ncbi:MAG: DUF5518 domain-containing protein [Methanobacteriaceae archaeon]|nr:DUF5518 domain-containing protein [Methanobacteriaceae archaeon]
MVNKMDSEEKEALFMFNWKAIIIGIVLTLLLGIGLRFIIPSLSGIISIIIACAVVGYMAKGHVMNGAIHGGAVGAIEGIITIILVLYFSGGLAGNNNVMMILLLALIGDISLGIIGGTIGNILKMFSISKS